MSENQTSKPDNADATRRQSSPILPTAITAACLAGLSLTREFYAKTALDIFFPITLFSVALVPIYVCVQLQFLWIFLGACALAALQFLVLGVQVHLLPFLGLIGIVSLIFLIIRRSIAFGVERDRLRSAVLPLLIVIALAALNGPLLTYMTRFSPRTSDSVLYVFDGSLGTQLSFSAGRVLRRAPSVFHGALLVYCVLPVMMMLVYAQQLRLRGAEAWRVLIAFCSAGTVGVIFYSLLPACGPAYFVGARFPFDPPITQQIGNAIAIGPPLDAYRNAFPSLHFAWALLAWWYSDGLAPATRRALLIFLVLTGVSALGLGEHYFIDLVAAVPFALMIQAIFAVDNPMFAFGRTKALLGGLISLLLWISLPRFSRDGISSAPVLWLLIALTCFTCVLLRQRLRLFPAMVYENASR
jgi:hypothetical protein